MSNKVLVEFPVRVMIEYDGEKSLRQALKDATRDASSCATLAGSYRTTPCRSDLKGVKLIKGKRPLITFVKGS